MGLEVGIAGMIQVLFRVHCTIVYADSQTCWRVPGALGHRTSGSSKDRCVLLESIRVDKDSETSRRKGLPVIAKDLLSGILSSLTGRESDTFFSDDRALLQAHEASERALYFVHGNHPPFAIFKVQELWRTCLGRSCDIGQVVTALDNTFKVEAVFARLPDNSWKLVGLARTVSDGAFVALVIDVCVHPQYRKRGFGTHMLQRLEESTRKSGAGTLGVFAHPSEFMFLFKSGFRYTKKYAVMRYMGPTEVMPQKIKRLPKALKEAL